ncbi:MAG: sulfatase [Planctomycetes bacterium]|nr:sulfatase [Planctomycetota bacterium]
MRLRAFVLAWFALGLGACDEAEAHELPPNVVVIVLDTARPDYLSAYGHPRPTTPFLDEFARTATRFDRAYSVSNWTLPAHASLFSGLPPDVHLADQAHRRICDGAPLLAERLADARYQTFGVSNNPWVAERTGLTRGFERFVEHPNREPAAESWPGDTRFDHPTARIVQDWFEHSQRPNQPFFLFVNLIEPHLPYVPPFESAEPFFASRQEFESAIKRFFFSPSATLLQNRHYAGDEPLSESEWTALRSLYEGELRRTDAITRALLATIDAHADPRNTLVFVVSDHGENLGEHGQISHLFGLYETNLRIACFARGPGFVGGAVRDDLVQITDLYPTILRAAGLAPEPSCVGVDLLGPLPEHRTLRALLDVPTISIGTFPPELVARGVFRRFEREQRAVVGGRFKSLRAGDAAPECYDLELDPDELATLDATVPRAGDFAAVLAELARPLGPALCSGAVAAPDAQGDEELRALGYLGDAR